MNEPSVLDYVKSKLFFWKQIRIEIPPAALDASPTQEAAVDSGSVADSSITAADADAVPAEATPAALPLAWGLVLRVLSPLVLALLAQITLDNPARTVGVGMAVFFYALAAALLILSIRRSEWVFKLAAPPTVQADPLTVRARPLWVAIPLAVLAYIAFGDNRFTTFNLIVWSLALLAYLAAFWLADRQSILDLGAALHTRWQAFRQRGLQLSPWTLALLFSFALIAFFRLYLLESVPAEMFSDHAEKLIDVGNVLDGQTAIFFPRNTGREAFQMYLTATMALLFNTGLSFLSLKLGTALCGLFTVPFIYLLGKEVANKRVGLLAMLFAGVAYWPNVISRVALRFTLYPFFTAPMLYFLVRGLRRRSRNDFILAGLFLGLGLHGYSPFRFVPFLVVIAFLLYLLHRQSRGRRVQAVWWLMLLALTALMVFLPLMRYALQDPLMFSFRGLSRMTQIERAFPAPGWQIFLQNFWKAWVMPFWDNGEIWVHSVTHRPALGIVPAALYFLGSLLLVVRYIRQRDWLDLFWLIAVPFLMLPSILSLAFPDENPSLNRTGAALIPVFLIVGMAADALLVSLKKAIRGPWGARLGWTLVMLLFFLGARQDYDLVFHQYAERFQQSSWNTSELGAIIRQFADTVGTVDSAWVVPYPHWVDTRLVGINAGVPGKDYALWPDQLEDSLALPGPKLFLYKPEDAEAAARLISLYPQGAAQLHLSDTLGKDFFIFYVPAVTP